jgi:Zn-finger nucleic acid-binding protein
MNCPNCGQTLQARERLGVEIDGCPGCRGVWLDRGELDKLLERESQYNNRRNRNDDDDDDYDDDDDDDDGALFGGGRQRGRGRGFFQNILDAF